MRKTTIEKLKPLDPRILIHVHDNLSHPFNLTWTHRSHIKENIEQFRVFMYAEDDMDIPFSNFINYLDCFPILWSQKFVPAFIRIEVRDGIYYNTEMRDPLVVNKENDIIELGCRKFTRARFPLPYHAFWICPQKELKEIIHDEGENFFRWETNLNQRRERAASLLIWNKIPGNELHSVSSPGLLQLNHSGTQVSPLCYSFHLPNNYIEDGRIQVEHLLKIV